MSELRPFEKDFEFLSRTDLDQLQFEKLKTMLRHVASTNRYYADRWKAAGVDVEQIQCFADFRRLIPMVEKSDFIRDQEDNPPFGTRLGDFEHAAERAEVYTTSGTSGQGVELHVQSKRELAIMERIYGYYFSWAGLSPGDITMLTLPITMLAGGRAEYQGGVAFDLSVFPIGNYNSEQKAELIQRFKPKALFGSTTYFAHLAKLLGDDARKIGVQTLLTGLEGVGLSFFQRLETQWNARCAERFGCAQMRADFLFTDESGVGGPGSPRLLFNIDPYVYLEILDVETGEPVKDGEFGELVVTSLYHFDNPVIRNRLKDGAIFREGRSLGGKRNFTAIELGSLSRIDDVKKIKGINVYPQAVDDLIFANHEIEQYQVVLTSSETFSDIATLRLQLRSSVPESGTPALGKKLYAEVKERLGIHFNIEFVPHIELSTYKARRWTDLRKRD